MLCETMVDKLKIHLVFGEIIKVEENPDKTTKTNL